MIQIYRMFISIQPFQFLNVYNDSLINPTLLQAQLPFAVVGSNTMLDINGKKLRGRMYPWGIAEVENPDHCDFIFLRNLLIRTHMQDLKDVTNNVLYENFRCNKLAAVTSVSLDSKLASSNR